MHSLRAQLTRHAWMQVRIRWAPTVPRRAYSAPLPRPGVVRGRSPSPSSVVARINDTMGCVDVRGGDPDGNPWQGSFHHVWLRDHCKCPACFHPRTLQRTSDTYAIPKGIRPRSAVATADGLRVTWEPDGHVSLYPWEWLHANNYSTRRSPAGGLGGEFGRKRLWGAEVARAAPRFDYRDVMGSDDALLAWLQAIHDTGFAFVDGVPLDKGDNERLARRIAYIRETLFGGFWDFSPNLEHGDTAYTTLALRAHTDGTYFNDPPGLQMFHCVFFNGTGGESLLVDGFRVASDLRRRQPLLFEYLSKTRIPAHYQDVGVNMRALVPMISLEEGSGNLVQIRYNGDDRDVLTCLPFNEVPVFYDALHEFNRALRDPDGEYRFRLSPNTVLVFDNWRVLHGRTAFTGDRRVLGCYINHDDYLSRLRTLREERGIQSEL